MCQQSGDMDYTCTHTTRLLCLSQQFIRKSLNVHWFSAQVASLSPDSAFRMAAILNWVKYLKGLVSCFLLYLCCLCVVLFKSVYWRKWCYLIVLYYFWEMVVPMCIHCGQLVYDWCSVSTVIWLVILDPGYFFLFFFFFGILDLQKNLLYIIFYMPLAIWLIINTLINTLLLYVLGLLVWF